MTQERIDTGVKTAGNSPASSPGLFSPSTPEVKPFDGGPYPSPYMHHTQRQAPKETHIADVDFDPVSGRKIINQYEVIDELGRGVHGKVKLGRSLQTGQHVAIKIVDRYSKRRRLGKNNSHEDKIRKEIAILKKARHPNIVSLLEVIDDPSIKKVYIVLEHVELGEVKWRIPGAKEICLLEYRKCEREAKGIYENDAAAIEDRHILQSATRRRARKEKQEIKETHRKLRDTENEAFWSLEYQGDNEEDDSEASLSRNSTASAFPELSAQFPSLAAAESVHTEPYTGLEGTMYGAYETEPNRARAPSIAGSASSQSLDIENNNYIPEHFRYVPLMTLQAARAAIRDTILGLEYLHYQGVVHRDIKPANLLSTREHRIKISDFGVSYLGRTTGTDQSGEQSESEAQDVDEAVELAKTVGTPAFYAPELCYTDERAETAAVTQAIDVWAVGITLYCLVFGRVPFHDENTFVLMKKIADESPYIPTERLKAVDDQPGSRPSSHGRHFQPTNSNKRLVHDLEYEAVDEELRDFLIRLLHKDPKRRLTLKEAKMHPWLLADIPRQDRDRWLEETNPARMTQGKRIAPTKEDINDAVVPLGVFDKVRMTVKKIGGALGLNRTTSTRTRRDRSKSSVTGLDGGPSSNASSSSTISQDARRPSLRPDEQISAILRSSRDFDHPLSHSLTASPEARDHAQFFIGPSSRPQSPEDVYDTASTALYRPTTLERAHSTMSTQTSVKTIKPSDISRAAHPRLTSPILPQALPGTPVALETPGGSGLGGIFGGAGRRLINNIRRPEKSSPGRLDHARTRSIDRLVGGDDDPHAQPSVALSDTVAAGHVDLPESLRENPPRSASAMSSYSPRFSIHSQSGRLHPDSATGTPSRQSSISSAASLRHETRSIADNRPSTRGSDAQSLNNETAEERFLRAKDELMRRRVMEENQARENKRHSNGGRPLSTFSQGDCPPSPDDEGFFGKRQDIDNLMHSHAATTLTSSLETSPMSHPYTGRGLISSSSEDQFASGLSQSTSNPSIPSVVSANSSIHPDDMYLDPVKEVVPRASEDTLNPDAQAPQYTINEEMYPQDHVVESADDEDEDSDDDFIEMGRRSRTGHGRSESISNAELARRRHRRGISQKSTRSESGGTIGNSRNLQHG
jgi:SNF1-activating kinase 1